MIRWYYIQKFFANIQTHYFITISNPVFPWNMITPYIFRNELKAPFDIILNWSQQTSILLFDNFGLLYPPRISLSHISFYNFRRFPINRYSYKVTLEFNNSFLIVRYCDLRLQAGSCINTGRVFSTMQTSRRLLFQASSLISKYTTIIQYQLKLIATENTDQIGPG